MTINADMLFFKALAQQAATEKKAAPAKQAQDKKQEAKAGAKAATPAAPSVPVPAKKFSK